MWTLLEKRTITEVFCLMLLFLSGNPISEKVTQYGPFVMNSQTEVMEAMRDYQMEKMGILI
ncbi:MAG: redox-sensitive bicupin YhaK (pirin superfamily) [Saprospiraceae bacterium]|jgi:redox-sensitive bicupin YhaK (pirin superfamily)